MVVYALCIPASLVFYSFTCSFSVLLPKYLAPRKPWRYPLNPCSSHSCPAPGPTGLILVVGGVVSLQKDTLKSQPLRFIWKYSLC